MDNTLSQKKPMFSNRALLSLTVPLIIESLFSLSTGIVDTIMVSSAGEAAVSGTSLSGPIHALLIMLFSSLAHGGVVLATQYIGSGDMERARSSARQLLYSSTAVAIFFSLLCMVFLPQILTFLFPTVESVVFESTKTYLFWILVGVP
ncbi:MAG: MATE family efflux transporter, partial [Oscillospiraceae bacterium]|nr:MATE family efflux transporter [Oscillospiraceae bacterium]